MHTAHWVKVTAYSRNPLRRVPAGRCRLTRVLAGLGARQAAAHLNGEVGLALKFKVMEGPQ